MEISACLRHEAVGAGLACGELETDDKKNCNFEGLVHVI